LPNQFFATDAYMSLSFYMLQIVYTHQKYNLEIHKPKCPKLPAVIITDYSSLITTF